MAASFHLELPRPFAGDEIRIGAACAKQAGAAWRRDEDRPGGDSRCGAVLQVIAEHSRDTEDEGMRLVSQAKTARIPAEFPVVAIDQVRHRPDQRLFPHLTGKVRRIALECYFVGQPALIQAAELLDP